jgi:hypothetical protein
MVRWIVRAQSSSMSIAPSVSSKTITPSSTSLETILDRFELGVSPSKASAAALFLPEPFSRTAKDADVPLPLVWPLDCGTDFFLLGIGEGGVGLSSLACFAGISRLFMGLPSNAVLARVSLLNHDAQNTTYFSCTFSTRFTRGFSSSSSTMVKKLSPLMPK